MTESNKSSVSNKPSAWLGAVLAGVTCSSVSAAGLTVDITLPDIQAGPYHRPYLAAWVERAGDQSVAGTLAVWYDQRLRDNLGRNWLRNLRTWWRKSGESMTLPADGVSGPTRAPGRQTLKFGADHPVLASLPAGDYVLSVEVAREQGGREMLRTPFHWDGPSGQIAATTTTAGSSELSEVRVGVTR